MGTGVRGVLTLAACVVVAACARPTIVAPLVPDAELPRADTRIDRRVALVIPHTFGVERPRLHDVHQVFPPTYATLGAGAEDAVRRWARGTFTHVTERHVTDDEAAAMLRGEVVPGDADLVLVPNFDGPSQGSVEWRAANWLRLRLDARDLRDGARSSWSATGESTTRLFEAYEPGPMRRALVSALRTLHDSVGTRFGTARAP